MEIKRTSYTTLCFLLATGLGFLLLAGCAFLPFERVDYKAYPTAENPDDFYGRVYARTRLEEVKVRQASSAEQASQGVGFPVRLPAYLPDGLEPNDTIVLSQAHAYQVNLDLNAARALLESANLPTDALPTTIRQIQVDAIISPTAVTSHGSDPHYVTLIQTRNPSYRSPPDADPSLLEELGKLGWQYLGLTPEQAERISRGMDWASFLALPPAGMGSAEFVEFNGITGVALSSGDGDNQDRAILWEEDGVLYGLYSDLPLSELQRIAASLE